MFDISGTFSPAITSSATESLAKKDWDEGDEVAINHLMIEHDTSSSGLNWVWEQKNWSLKAFSYQALLPKNVH